MKRCIICGKADEENNTVCSVCGGEIADVKDSDAEEMELQAEPEQETEERSSVEKMSKALEAEMMQEEADSEDPAQENETAQKEEPEESGNLQMPKRRINQNSDQAMRQPRRMKSGPQIYGQAGMTETDQAAYNAQQGVVRRNMQGRPMNGPQDQPMNRAAQGRPMGPQGQMMNGAAQGRLMNGPQGQPMNGAAQSRPMGPQGQMMSGAGQSRPMNGPQGQMMNGAAQGRPMGPQGQMMNGTAGRPMNMMPQGRPMNGGAGRYTAQIIETARKALKSPIFLLIAVLHTMYVGGAIAAIFLQQLNYSQVGRLLSGMELPQQITGYMTDFLELMTKLDSGAVAVNIVMHIPDMLFCLGLWLIFITALAAKEKMSGIGFLLVKIIVVLNMILNCIVMLAGLIISVTLVVAAWASEIQSMKIAAVVTMVLMILITMMVIMYYFCYMATIRTCRVNANTGEVYGTASAYVAVIHILMAIPAVINLLSGIVNSELANIVGAIGQIGWLVLFGIWIIRYRGKMSEFED